MKYLFNVILLVVLLAACEQKAATGTSEVPGGPIGTASATPIPTATSTVTPSLPPDTVDRREVIFNDFDGNLHRLNLDTMEITEIDTGVNCFYDIFLSPDGSKVACQSAGPEFDGSNIDWTLILFDLERDRQVQIADRPSEDIWDPHGEYLITSVDGPDFYGPAIVSAVDGSLLASLDRANSGDSSLPASPDRVYFIYNTAISPDGQIVYSDIHDGLDAIQFIGLDFGSQGEVERFVEQPELILRPFTPNNEQEIILLTISPDGSQIAFLRNQGEWERSVDGLHADLFVMNIDGSGLVNLTGGKFLASGRGLDQGLVWSPSGHQIAFLTYPSGSPGLDLKIHVVNTDGTGMVEITDDQFSSGWSPSWSPDGSQLLFVTYKGYGSLGQIVFSNPDGSSKTVLPGVESARQAAFRPAYSLHASPVNCASRFTRLEIGMQAVVAEGGTGSNRVRSEPKLGNNLITSIFPGTELTILDGPVCADGLIFWRVENASIPGGSGWTAEGDGAEYWLEPYNP